MNKLGQNYQLAQDILDLTEKEIQNMPQVNVLIVGKSGVGKSTLINSVFRENLADTGIGKPVTKHLRKITKEGIPIALYDTQGLELEESVQEKVRQEIFTLIDQNKGTPEAIHVCYYCIQATSSRIEDSEIELIKEIATKIPVILVLTMSIGEEAKRFADYLAEMKLPVKGIQMVLARPYVISDEITISAFGLKELIQKTLKVLPSQTKKAFTNAQMVDIEEKVKAATRWARRYIITTFGVGFTPIPFSDASVLVPMQVTMLAHITAIFGINIDKSTIVSIIAAIAGTGSATYIGRKIVSNAFKFIPGIGTIAGGLISGTTASIVTSALSSSYIQVLRYLALTDQIDEKPQKTKIIELMQIEFQKFIKDNRKDLQEEAKKHLDYKNSTLKSDIYRAGDNILNLGKTIWDRVKKDNRKKNKKI